MNLVGFGLQCLYVGNLNVGDTDIPCWCRGTADCSVTLDWSSERIDEVRTDTVSLCVPIVAEDHYVSLWINA